MIKDVINWNYADVRKLYCKIRLMDANSTFRSFRNSPNFSIKHTNYFDIYDEILKKYVGKRISFVEIGILDGGSLFMWRDFLGENARIIGVDLNPEAVKWRDHGFEIVIGDQSDPNFWLQFFQEIGDVDVLLDDGGHRNDQQIVTLESALPRILDGGMIIVEDTQTSFMKFESFRKYTFVHYLQAKIQALYARSGELRLSKERYSELVHSIEFFTGICVVKVDRTKCAPTNRIENSGTRNNANDFRYENDGSLVSFLRFIYNWISWDNMSDLRAIRHPFVNSIMKSPITRFSSRLFIVPVRFCIYLLLKSSNYIHLRRTLNQIKDI